MAVSDAQRDRQQFRRAVTSIGPDGGVQVGRLTYRGYSANIDALLAAAGGQGLNPGPAGQLTPPGGGSYFIVGVSLVGGPDIIA